MKDTAKTYFLVMYILDLIFGILACITIFGLVVGIPLIIAATKFNKAQKMTDAELISHRSGLLGWGIFSAICLCGTVVGLIAVLIFAFMVDDYIRKLELGSADANKSFSATISDGAATVWQNTKEAFGVSDKNVDTSNNLDKQAAELEKAKKMFEDGLITEEEYKEVRKHILGI